jgi:hypothetical protein
MLNPTAANHSAPVTSVQPAAPNNLNNSTDVRWYPTPRMRQIEQSPQRYHSGNASTTPVAQNSTEPQTQHVSGGTKGEGRNLSKPDNASYQSAPAQYSGQSASASPTTPTIQPVRGWGKIQNSQP